jgi:hypothetical protein
MKKNKFYLMNYFIILIFLLSSCARTSAYRQEQDYQYSDFDAYSEQAKTSVNKKIKSYGQPKKKIYALSFFNETEFGDDKLGAIAQEELLLLLKSSKKAIVPDEVRLTSSSREFFNGDKVRLSPLIKTGKQIGVNLIIVGKIKKIQYRQKGDEVGIFKQKKSLAAVEVEARVFDTKESKEIVTLNRIADSTLSQTDFFGNLEKDNPQLRRMELIEDAIKNAMRLLARDIDIVIDKISWEGRIVKVVGSNIYINAGRLSGLNIGDILKVLTQGEDIYDPLTGAYIGRSQGQPKGTIEVKDYIGPDAALCVIHSGGGFFENDVVQLY